MTLDELPVPPLSVAHHPIEIGGLRLANPLLLAPLAGVTIPALRLLYSKLGAGAVHTEMISCAGLLASEKKPRRKKKPGEEEYEIFSRGSKTERMLAVLEGESPVIAQLFSGDAETMTRGAEYASRSSEKNRCSGHKYGLSDAKGAEEGRRIEIAGASGDSLRNGEEAGCPGVPCLAEDT